MRILFNDIIQYSDAPPELKSPALSDTFNGIQKNFTIKFGKQYPVNAIGIGNTDGNNFTVSFVGDDMIYRFQFSENGLYVMPKTVIAAVITINTNAGFIGRLGAGLGVHIPTAIAKEPL